MDLLDLLPIVRRRWAIVVGTVLACLVIAAAFVLVTPRSYAARSQVFVATSSSRNDAELAQGSAFTQARVQSYVRLVTTTDVTAPVVRRLHLTATPQQLA
ncbi:MAG TPA: Wzz/FepE/Etk N-terminal domain-containing protein, partial [Acidimicrobiales bacterium]